MDCVIIQCESILFKNSDFFIKEKDETEDEAMFFLKKIMLSFVRFEPNEELFHSLF